MRLLAFETSCDETSAAVVVDGTVLSNVVSSQTALHAEYGGVVPELAAREHGRNLSRVVRSALDQAGVNVDAIEGVAATRGPGLPSALMIGFKAGQAFAFARGLPFLAIHHHEAHLYSPWITGAPPHSEFDQIEPHVALVVSGGHTLLVRVTDDRTHHVLGRTLDDAAGECFDKVGKLLGLPYPGGPILDRLAGEGDPAAFRFPRPLLQDPSWDFSFSGLKTSVRYYVRDHPEVLSDPRRLRDLCAGVQAAIVEVLVTKTIRAALKYQVRTVTASGGVTCNRGLRTSLIEHCQAKGLGLRLAEPALCTDNAAMVGVLAEYRLGRGAASDGMALDVLPGWPLAEAAGSDGQGRTAGRG